MTTKFPLTITTAEELRLLKQEKRAEASLRQVSVFDEFDHIRAHWVWA